jgi:hypothetical protein
VRGAWCAVLALAVSATVAGAQVRDTSRTRRDTIRGRGDTAVVRRDSAAKRDTTKEIRVPVPPGADSLLRDSLARRDSARARIARDTIKAPLASYEAAVLADPTGSFVWDRRDVFSTGALTVQDLLDRMPGATGLRSGWISQPMITSFLGDPARVRVYLDGLELRELDPRMENGRIWDLTQIPLWALDDIRVERSASEIRIHMRSWRVDRTTPYTRTDVYTGDQSTNLYRGLFGRRYQHGEVLQLAGQQFGNNPGRGSQSSDQLSALARVGMARKGWSVDAMLLRGDRNRGHTLADTPGDTVPAVESTRTDAYLRAGWGTPDRGPWVQTIASTSKYAYGGKKATGVTGTEIADTSLSEAQYLLSGGYALGRWRVSAAQRYRVGLRRKIATPSARLSWESQPFTFTAFADGRGPDSTRRFELSGVARPLSFVFLGAAVGQEQLRTLPDSVAFPGLTDTPRFMRGEAGLRVKDVWLSGGILRRDAVLLEAPRIFKRQTLVQSDPALLGQFVTVRGRLWKALYADIQAMQWNDTGWYYRPRYQTRSELYISTSLLDRFPRKNFHFLASAVHEYRSSSLWPDSSGTQRVPGYRTISTMIQFKILQAEVFWSARNLLVERYAQIPGYRLPRLSNIYGVRWEFWD